MALTMGSLVETDPDASGERSGWQRGEQLIAIVGTVLIGLNFSLGHSLTIGNIVAMGSLPLWIGDIRRYVGAVALVVIGALCVPTGLVLTYWSSTDHDVSIGMMADTTIILVGAMACFGFLLWSLQRVGAGWLATLYGLGMLAGVSASTSLFSSNPWRFGYSIPVIVLTLGLASRARTRMPELVIVAVLVVVSGTQDARSGFGLLLLCLALMAWQARPTAQTVRGSAVRALLGLGTVALIVYNVGTALILNGFLGALTQQRTQAQLAGTNSVILGGRPEGAATVALFADHPLGFGSGTMPNGHDVAVAKNGLWAIGYEPNNGYVEHWMFGGRYSMHSVVGDLWTRFGFIGILFVVALLVVALRGLGTKLSTRTASAIYVYLALKTLWNLAFAPWHSSVPLLVLFLALTFDHQVRHSKFTGGLTDQ